MGQQRIKTKNTTQSNCMLYILIQRHDTVYGASPTIMCSRDEKVYSISEINRIHTFVHIMDDRQFDLAKRLVINIF